MIRTFLPWYRCGLATAISAPPPSGSARATFPMSASLREHDAEPLAVPAVLAGPGDVIGLDRREIRRTEPFDGCADFEPSYFPYVELASADLPWRFSPLAPVDQPLADPERPGDNWQQQRLRPWLALVVVPEELATLSPPAPGGLPILRCPAGELPDLADAWAWAHVQVTHADDEPVADALERPERRLSRLLCPRRLTGDTRYVACVVPTFAAGVRAIVPDALPGADPLGPAWVGPGEAGAGRSGFGGGQARPSDTVTLPVYAQWAFGTGADGSFDALVRKLRPHRPASSGDRTIRTGEPGWGAETDPDGTAVMQGALRPLGRTEPEPSDAGLAEALRAVISRAGNGVELRPPVYGQDYQGGTAGVAPGDTGWLAELNTDPRRRLAAGLAARAVAAHQDELVGEAWDQLAAVRGRDGGNPELAEAVGGSLTRRHNVAPAGVSPALARLARSAMVHKAPPVLSTLTSKRELFAPRFTRPAYTFLPAIGQEWLVPGVAELPPDCVALVETNGAFVESFLVGLNHALARELVARRYPLDVTATFFDRFWDGPAVPPIGGWTESLGGNVDGGDRLGLLLRGALVRRFPTVEMHLEREDERRSPVVSGRIGADAVFFGFPLTRQDAEGWRVVLQEALDHPRFGCAASAERATGARGALRSWQGLNWAHPQVAGRKHVPVAGTLAGIRRPIAGDGGPSAVWGLDAGHLAIITQRPAVRVRLPLSLWLGDA